MEKIKYFQRNSLLRVDTFNEGVSVSSQHSKSAGQCLKIQKLAEEANEIRKKRIVEENKRNRIKLALELHQQMYNELELAAVFIQKHVRMFLAKKVVRKMMAEKLKYENYLLMLQNNIQNYWLEDHCVKHVAAFRIQRYWKGFRKHPLKLDLVKRLSKRLIEAKNFKKLQKILKIQRKTAKKIIALNEKILKNIQDKNFQHWKNFQLSESSESNSESLESIKNLENCEENVEVLKILEVEAKPVKNEEIRTSFNPEKPSLLKPEIFQRFPQIPEYPRSKNFILSEANFHRPTLASKGKRFDTPDEVVTVKKSKKVKTFKTRRLLKQTTSRLVYIHEKNQENQKREQSARVRMTSEVKLRPPAVPQLVSIQSKLKENLIKRAQRSTSFSVERKESFRKDEEKSEDPSEKPQINPPTLNFQQALPDLYEFLENYRPNLRKNPVIQSTSGLVVHRLK